MEAESNPFTLDTSSGWLRTPTLTLARTDGTGARGLLRFSPDGLTLAQTEGARLLLWNLQSTRPPIALAQDGGEVLSVEFTPPGDQLLTSHADGTVRLWDAVTLAEVRRLHAPGNGHVRATMAPDGARVLVARGSEVGVYRLADLSLIGALPGLTGEATAMALASEGVAIVASSTLTLSVWDTASGAIRQRLEGHNDLITAVGFLPEASHAFSASRDGTVRLWDLASGAMTLRLQHRGPVGDAMISGNRRLLATRDESHPGNAYLWDLPSGGLVRVLADHTPTAERLRGLALSPDHTLVATTHDDGQVRLWETGLEPQPAQPVTPVTPGTTLPVTLRSHGLYYFALDADAGRNLVVSLDAGPSGNAAVPSGRSRARHGLSTDAEFGNVGARAPDRRQLQGVRNPPPNADITAFRMTAVRGRLPSVYDYDAFAQASVNDLRCELPVASSAGGKVYVLVFAPHLAAGSISARLRVEYADFHVSSISPATGGNAGSVTAEIDGTGITPDTTAVLIGADGGTSPGQLALFGNSTRAWYTFPLANAPPGRYGLELRRHGHSPVLLANAFTVTPGTGPRLEARIQAPSAARPGRDYNLIVEYANVGDADLPAPLFVLTANVVNLHPGPVPLAPVFLPSVTTADSFASRPIASQFVTLRSDSMRASMQIPGLNQSGGPPTLLAPGARFTLPVRFTGDRTVANMTFRLDVLRADTTPVDWTALEAIFRPPDLENTLWSPLWVNFQQTAGATWADYLRALNREAELNALAGESSVEIGKLLAALFARASGAPYQRTLASAVDAGAPAPHLPLQFTRSATDGLEHRFTVGPLGRGWSHGFEYMLEPANPAADSIVVRSPGGGARRFLRAGTGLWFGDTGDPATLSLEPGGGFALSEKDGLVWRFEATGPLATLSEPNGNTITLTREAGLLTRLQHSAGPGFSLGYDSRGRLIELVDHAGQRTEFRYDPSGEYLREVVAPGNVITRYDYRPPTGLPADHVLREIEYPDHTHQFYEHDARGRLVGAWRDQEAEKTTLTYDDRGRIFLRDAIGNTNTYLVDARGQLLTLTDPSRREVNLRYDANQNLALVAGPAGDTTELAYDGLGNLRRVINPAGHTLAFSYSPLSRLSRFEDTRGNPTEFRHDVAGNLTNIVYADGSAEGFEHERTGASRASRNRRGQTITYRRNALGQIEQKRLPSGRVIDFGYDSRGHLTHAVDSLLGTTSMMFDPRGFLTNITYPDGKGFTIEYNDAGRRTKRIGHGDGYTLQYEYDAVGRLEWLRDGQLNPIIHYQYDPRGLLRREDKGNGTWTSYEYDPAGQVTNLVNHAPDGSIQSRFQYGYDRAGNRTNEITLTGETRYRYDVLNQLIQAEYPGGRIIAYEYDRAGNRTKVTDAGSPILYIANNLNQYLQVGAATYAYDTDGNLVLMTDATGVIRYEYDSDSRLTRIDTAKDGIFDYTYGAFGDRVVVTHRGQGTLYLHDPVGLVDVVAKYNASGALLTRYDHGLGLVAQRDELREPAFFAFDALGNTKELTGLAGAVLNSYAYDAFGTAIAREEALPNANRFAGQFGVLEELPGLLFMRFRFYAGSEGRFLSADPIGISGGDLNLYRYAENAPTTYIDPLGLMSRSEEFQDIRRKTYELTARKRTEGFRGDKSAKSKLSIFTDRYLRCSDWQRLLLRTLGGEYEHWQIHPAARESNRNRDYFDHFFVIITDQNGQTWKIDPWEFPDQPFQPLDPAETIYVIVVRPIDPNDKLSPPGVGPNRVVPLADEIEYTIRFENFATASAPVQELVVVDYLDSGLDWTTVRFKEVAYGGRILTPASNDAGFVMRDTPPADSPAVSGTGAATMVIDLSVNRNPQVGRLEWRLTAVDTNTLTFPLDALTGFLPPENGTGRGHGYVRFGVRPRANIPLGTVITNLATIDFDGNLPIQTPVVFNTVGDIPSLAATISYLPGPILAGTPFSYRVSITNTAAADVPRTFLTNAIPPGVTVLGVNATVGTASVQGTNVVWDLGALASGVDATLTIEARSQNGGTFENRIDYTGGSGLAIYSYPSPLLVRVAPSLHAPSALDAWRDEVLVVAGVSVSDPDVGDAPVTLDLSASHGVLTVRNDVSGGVGPAAVSGNGSRAVRLVASVAEINATLAAAGGLAYQPDLGYTGADALGFHLTDGGSPGGGAALAATATTSITVRSRPQVVGRFVFYDQSAWDTSSDDAAVPPCKTALLPGIKASFANYTSYTRGLNGIMVDIQGLPGEPTAADFSFHVGNSDNTCSWAAGPTPSAVTVRRGAGTGGSDRISLFWGAEAVKKKWLQIRVRATTVTGLAVDDIFYFGNAPGETGNNPADAIVNATDEIETRVNPRSPFQPASICNSYDFNRDKQVNATDQISARLNTTSAFTALRLITPNTTACAGASAAGASGGNVPSAPSPEATVTVGLAKARTPAAASLPGLPRGSGRAALSAPSKVQVVSVARPELGIRVNGAILELYWPAATAGFQLETAVGLTGSTLWTPVPTPPATAGGQQVVPIQIDTATRLYRLRQR